MSIQRTKIITNPKFQYSFTVIVSTPIIVLSFLIPYIINDALCTVIDLTQANMPLITPKLLKLKTSYLSVIYVLQACFSIFTFLLCLLLSHAVAGPLFKFRKYLTNIREGHQSGILFFRKNDYFQEIAVEVTQTFDYLNEKNEKDLEKIRKAQLLINSFLDKASVDKKHLLEEASLELQLITISKN